MPFGCAKTGLGTIYCADRSDHPEAYFVKAQELSVFGSGGVKLGRLEPYC